MKKRRILVVEDDRDTRSALTEAMRDAGFEVSAVGDAIAAVAEARREVPDAIVLDLGLPGGSGLGVLESLRTMSTHAFTPIVVVSGRGEEDMRAAERRGATHCMHKPVSRSKLVQMLELAMRERDASADNGKVLIAEDDADARKALAMRLRSAKYRVAEVGDGASIMPAIRREKPDVLLLDIGLPGGDGLSVLERMREQPDLASLPVIVVSANEPSSTAMRALSKGARAYVTKPYDAKDLIRMVDEEITMSMLNGGLDSWN